MYIFFPLFKNGSSEYVHSSASCTGNLGTLVSLSNTCFLFLPKKEILSCSDT